MVLRIGLRLPSTRPPPRAGETGRLRRVELERPATDHLDSLSESSTTRQLRRLHVTRLRDRWLRRTARPVGHIHRPCYRN
jgi:hypothetical protein